MRPPSLLTIQLGLGAGLGLGLGLRLGLGLELGLGFELGFDAFHDARVASVGIDQLLFIDHTVVFDHVRVMVRVMVRVKVKVRVRVGVSVRLRLRPSINFATTRYVFLTSSTCSWLNSTSPQPRRRL